MSLIVRGFCWPAAVIVFLGGGLRRWEGGHLGMVGLFAALERIFELLVDERDSLENVLRDRVPEVPLLLHAARPPLSLRAQHRHLRRQARLVLPRLHRVNRFS